MHSFLYAAPGLWARCIHKAPSIYDQFIEAKDQPLAAEEDPHTSIRVREDPSPLLCAAPGHLVGMAGGGRQGGHGSLVVASPAR
jgi:hypothetical protein